MNENGGNIRNRPIIQLVIIILKLPLENIPKFLKTMLKLRKYVHFFLQNFV